MEIRRLGLLLLGFTGAIITILGCDSPRAAGPFEVEKPPKPVSVMTLNRTQQLRHQTITGSVAPWKSERIGFEVSGRINFVIEPNEGVQPHLHSRDAKSPTILASLEPERFQLAVETAKADVAVAERRLEANRVTIEQRLPTSIASAEAEHKLAAMELARFSQLSKQNAISRSELDSATTQLVVASAALEAAQAALSQAQAEQLVLAAQIAREQVALSEAERDLRNSVLRSSFQGIVADVHTSPGSFVQAGAPVVTVQMMDPMLVQFEVSPEDSRNYARGDILNVLITDQDGNQKLESGLVYTVDLVADSNSRTYTVTLHVRNCEVKTSDHQLEKENLAETDAIFPLNLGSLISNDDRQLVEERCIHQIGNETFVWKVSNRKWNQPSDRSNRLLAVEPVRVSVGSEVIPLLGNWHFKPIEFPDVADIDPAIDFITGQLNFARPEVAQDPLNWLERKVLVSQKQWQLRSGDLVQVLLSNDNDSIGFFVPMKSVMNQNGRTFLNVVDGLNSTHSAADQERKAKRVAVEVCNHYVASESSMLLKVKAINQHELAEGIQIVVGGTHYLEDGDRIRLVTNAGVDQ
ncbi:efflux RND transporter periplasmic adaptor subunit [Pirellulaceae bacterium SH449]